MKEFKNLSFSRWWYKTCLQVHFRFEKEYSFKIRCFVFFFLIEKELSYHASLSSPVLGTSSCWEQCGQTLKRNGKLWYSIRETGATLGWIYKQLQSTSWSSFGMATAECGIMNGAGEEDTGCVDKLLQMIHLQYFTLSESWIKLPVFILVLSTGHGQPMVGKSSPSLKSTSFKRDHPLAPGMHTQGKVELWQNPKSPSSTHSQILVAKDLSFSEVFFKIIVPKVQIRE